MSGGSYDYTTYDMESGQLDKVLRNIDSALVDFEKMAAAAIALTRPAFETVDGQRRCVQRELSKDEVVLTEAGINALRCKLKSFAEALQVVSKEARELAPLFRTLEWFASCDYGEEALQDTALVWAKERFK